MIIENTVKYRVYVFDPVKQLEFEVKAYLPEEIESVVKSLRDAGYTVSVKREETTVTAVQI